VGSDVVLIRQRSPSLVGGCCAYRLSSEQDRRPLARLNTIGGAAYLADRKTYLSIGEVWLPGDYGSRLVIANIAEYRRSNPGTAITHWEKK
jgi:hypothetical protein